MSSLAANPFILKLDSPDARLELVGGKGASLARMAVAGLPVPPGFQITTHAYGRFVSANCLAEAILSAAAQARADDPATLDRASTQIQSLVAREYHIPAVLGTGVATERVRSGQHITADGDAGVVTIDR